MTVHKRFEKLLAPGRIGKLRIKNRIVKTCGGAEDIGIRNRNFLESIARGGAGLIIWGDVAVEHPRGITIPITQRHLQDETNLPAIREIAEAIHKHDCPVFMQIFHAGPQAFLEEGLQTISSSALTEEEQAELLVRMCPKELTIPEIEDLVDRFAHTAELARRAGFDGVEVNAARMHLLNSFLSRAWNKREDRYGSGGLENRTRFLVEIIREIKKRLGKNFPLITLINGIELRIPNGTTVEEARGIAKILEEAGADAIHVRAFGYHGFDGLDASPKGAYYSEDTKPLPKELDWSRGGKGALSPLSAAIKEVVSIPVMTVGALERPEVAESILKEGKADFIGICKGLMADPEIATKVAAARVEDIAFCPDCKDCARLLLSMIGSPRFVPIRCRLNAALGSEQSYEIPPAEKKKRVVVVGGGPAGMEAARVSAIRGHEVILYEKEKRLGGLLPYVAMIKGLDADVDAMDLAVFLKKQLTKLGVEIRLKQEFNPSMIPEIKPDAVVLATGGVPVVPEIPGLEDNAVSVEDLCLRLKDDLDLMEPAVMRHMSRYWESVGRRVVIIGGTVEGSSLAEFLVERCRKVTIVDENTIYGDGLIASHSMKKVIRRPCTKVKEIIGKRLNVLSSDGNEEAIEADTIITAASPGLNTELLKAFESKAVEAYLVGREGHKPGSIMNAIGNGYWIARRI
jgi:2,4-dienoyl-CoA reductase (NADPH2)